jgi:hypothetical protein
MWKCLFSQRSETGNHIRKAYSIGIMSPVMLYNGAKTWRLVNGKCDIHKTFCDNFSSYHKIKYVLHSTHKALTVLYS